MPMVLRSSTAVEATAFQAVETCGPEIAGFSHGLVSGHQKT